MEAEAVAAVQDKHTSASIKKRPGRTEDGEGFPREMKSSGNEDVAGSLNGTYHQIQGWEDSMTAGA